MFISTMCKQPSEYRGGRLGPSRRQEGRQVHREDVEEGDTDPAEGEVGSKILRTQKVWCSMEDRRE